MVSYDTGYDDERFLHPVGHTLHCGICTNVLKDPVMCDQNEHLFCRACIIMHLTNSQTCPNCIEPLTVATLTEASRGIRNLLAELKIKCDFFDRGCGKFIELERLEKHIVDCGFAPAFCSNEGCRLQVNKQDLLHHETAVCELRRVKCHSCSDIKREVDTMNVKLSKIDEKLNRSLDRADVVQVDLGEKVERVQQQLFNQQETNRQLKVDNEEVKKSLAEMTEQLKRMSERFPLVQTEQMVEEFAKVDEVEMELKVVIAGGRNETGRLNTVEMFSLSNGTWTELSPLKRKRSGASSVVCNNQVFIMGGYIFSGGTRSIEKLSINEAQGSLSMSWENFRARLPTTLFGHCSVVYDERLIVIGGYDDKQLISNNISEISLTPPYATKLLATMPLTRWLHAVTMLEYKMIIVGGRHNTSYGGSLSTVLVYDIIKNEFQELAPLPYAVSEMAVVKWGDDNVMVIGGADSDGRPLNKVLMYNVKTQKSHMLPDMQYKRLGCSAAVVKETVIVMGGKDEGKNFLSSVEAFTFDSFSWHELPEMQHKRYLAPAVSYK